MVVRLLRLPRLLDATLYAAYRALAPLIAVAIAVRVALYRLLDEVRRDAERLLAAPHPQAAGVLQLGAGPAVSLSRAGEQLVSLFGAGLVAALVAAFFGLRRAIVGAVEPLVDALRRTAQTEARGRTALDGALKAVVGGDGEDGDGEDGPARTVEDVALRAVLRRARLYREALARYTVARTVDELDRALDADFAALLGEAPGASETAGAAALRSHATLRHATVLFCDLKGFTALSDRAPLSTVLRLLEAFFEIVCDEVERHGGTVGSFLGDGALCIWEADGGAQDPKAAQSPGAADAGSADGEDGNENENESRSSASWSEDASTFGAGGGAEAARGAINAACLAAFGVLRRLEESPDPEVRALDCRFGINAGSCLVGVFGCARRLSYTAISDAVNVASRVESATRLFNARVLIHGSCVQHLGPALRSRYVGAVEAKGKAGSLPLYEVLLATPRHQHLIDLTAQLQTLLDAGELLSCLRLASRTLQAYPGDDVVHGLLARCLDEIQNPQVSSPF
ncbi:Adenylate cyclase [Giardia muris]|uniref:Adenylate cyclase n=1 Tax=Giardia muris TaxID=5742 RepID=A0A4Z1T3I1_GIAMU|nr:Adenylate cyclase [Giardia muris]|eukprot:TNJ27607.1 Adenylate cyclase [Giardia muris]